MPRSVRWLSWGATVNKRQRASVPVTYPCTTDHPKLRVIETTICCLSQFMGWRGSAGKFSGLSLTWSGRMVTGAGVNWRLDGHGCPNGLFTHLFGFSVLLHVVSLPFSSLPYPSLPSLPFLYQPLPASITPPLLPASLSVSLCRSLSLGSKGQEAGKGCARHWHSVTSVTFRVVTGPTKTRGSRGGVFTSWWGSSKAIPQESMCGGRCRHHHLRKMKPPTARIRAFRGLGSKPACLSTVRSHVSIGLSLFLPLIVEVLKN